MCECHKLDKVAIYDIYFGLELLHKKNDFQRFGDFYSYYYNIKVEPVYSVEENMTDEIVSLERDLMNDLRYNF